MAITIIIRSNQGGTSAQNLDVRSAMIVWAKGFLYGEGEEKKVEKLKSQQHFYREIIMSES